MQYSVKTNPIGERDKELLKMAPIFSHFPIKFKSGVTYTNLQVCCLECGKAIQEENTLGEVIPVLDNMTQVEARAYCKECNLVTPAKYRLYSDGRYMGIQNGKWTTYHMKKEIPMWRKILKFLFW